MPQQNKKFKKEIETIKIKTYRNLRVKNTVTEEFNRMLPKADLTELMGQNVKRNICNMRISEENDKEKRKYI